MEKQRNTKQREIVYNQVAMMTPHVTADEVYDAMHDAHPSISKATVYRNLNALVSNGRLMRISAPIVAERYETNEHPHYHIRCIYCGKIADSHLPYLDHLNIDSQANESDFIVTGHSLLFEGICSKCRNKS